MEFKYLTDSGNLYSLYFYVKPIKLSDLVYDPEKIRGLCKSGCKNFNLSGGCPPKAPLLEKMCSFNETAVFIACKFDSVYKPIKVKESKNIAIHWKFQDAILARLLNNLGQKLKDTYNGKFLGTGYCMGCPGKKCAFKLGEIDCRNPLKRTFSMEATGINVEESIKNIFNMKLYWYTKGIFDVPYMLKSMVFFKENGSEFSDKDIYIMIKSLPRIQL